MQTSTCPTEKSYATTKTTTMLCNECGHALPSIRDSSTICSNCKVPVATWWDETSQTFRTNRESILPDPSKTSSAMASPFYVDEKDREKMRQRRNTQSIEERNFNTALVMLEGHFARPQSYMASSMVVVKKMVATTLEMSLNKADVRYAFFFYPVLPWFILQQMLMFFQRNPSQKRRYLDASAENLQQCCQSPRLSVFTTTI
jgi:SpoVK/Ycf46/Vps4 family AAA+-type ATPase